MGVDFNLKITKTICKRIEYSYAIEQIVGRFRFNIYIKSFQLYWLRALLAHMRSLQSDKS